MKSQFRLGTDGVYRCEELSRFEFAKHGFGSRLGNPPADVTLRQIHSDIVVDARGLADREREGDALISNIPGCTIGVRTADCVPILLLDSVTHSVAAIHAGWRGSAKKIVLRAVECLTANFDALPLNLFAAIGPCIQECCYEVGPDVAQQFLSFFPEWSGEIGRRTVDLPETNRRHLTAAGIPDKHIFDSGLCTACSLDCFFSYRREPENPGRMIASITRLF